MNIKEKFNNKRGITVINDNIIPQGDDIITQSTNATIDSSTLNNFMDEATKECFDKIYHAFKYLEGESKHEPDFSILEVARRAIALYHDMHDNGDHYITGIKYQESWSKEDLGLFISNLFETLLDFLDQGQEDLSRRN